MVYVCCRPAEHPVVYFAQQDLGDFIPEFVDAGVPSHKGFGKLMQEDRLMRRNFWMGPKGRLP